jgi:hypothetical protein
MSVEFFTAEIAEARRGKTEILFSASSAFFAVNQIISYWQGKCRTHRPILAPELSYGNIGNLPPSTE